MNKQLLSLCSIGMSIALLSACHNFDADELPGSTSGTPTTPAGPTPAPTSPATTYSTSFFSIGGTSGSSFTNSAFPAATSSSTLSGVTMNNQALQGGMNFISISSPVPYSKFYIGIDGQNGYWTYEPSSSDVTMQGGNYVYNIPISYGTGYNQDVDMVVSGVEQNGGGVTKPYKTKVKYVTSLSGDLNINLTFSNAKDIDLHVYTPSGYHIFYDNRGGEVIVNGKTYSFGLDHDSNAGCSIDNLNNENIYIPSELIEKGTYRVVVDMYENCTRSIATSWSVVARYKGNVIPASKGANPANGVYPVNAGNNDMTNVMEFYIADGTATLKSMLTPDLFQPVMRSDMDQMKSEEAAFRLELKK